MLEFFNRVVCVKWRNRPSLLSWPFRPPVRAPRKMKILTKAEIEFILECSAAQLHGKSFYLFAFVYHCCQAVPNMENRIHPSKIIDESAYKKSKIIKPII